MQQVQLSRGAIPIFAGADMADIQAFIRARGLRGDRGVELLPLPEPTKAPEVGQHTESVMESVLGYDEERIAALREGGIFG